MRRLASNTVFVGFEWKAFLAESPTLGKPQFMYVELLVPRTVVLHQ